MTDDHARTAGPMYGRRDLMKLGAGVVATALGAPALGAQRGDAGRGSADAPNRPAGVRPHTEVGWINDANRASGNGPMDETTRQIVKYVSGFSESVLSDAVVHTVNRTMVDTMACLISGFESEPARICARLARMYHCDLKSTVMGYGIATSPDLATFANGTMARYADFNDIGPGNHTSDNIAGVLAIGEALHASGTQVMVATVLAYEVAGALAGAGRVVPPGGANGGGWDDWVYLPATAMAAGKLMGLNEDQLANALSLAIVPHMPMSVTHTGALSHWKACRASENVRHGVWAAIMAREGMTGPSMPFEARNGYFDHTGAFRELRLPANTDGTMSIQKMGTKRTPTEGSSQAALELVPQIREFTRADDIESIRYEMPFGGWQEIADPPKFDPRNRETADHSMPYMLARALMDGEIYLDSFTKEKFMDPSARQLMAKMTFWPQLDWTGNAPARITIRKKSGEEKSWDSFNGIRNAPAGQVNTPMTDGEITHKFDRVCAFMRVPEAQRDRARATWGNLRAVKDIGEAIRTLATFGRPAAL
jgi:2-methylcitrate dehydratase